MVASSKSPRLAVKPVRYDSGRGWKICDTHRAQQWAVTLRTANGRKRCILTRHATKARAEEQLTVAQRSLEGPLRQYKLGRRMPPSEGTTP